MKRKDIVLFVFGMVAMVLSILNMLNNHSVSLGLTTLLLVGIVAFMMGLQRLTAKSGKKKRGRNE